MLWVRSRYAGSLAVACAWLGALLPWNVTHAADVAGGSLLFLRFPFFQVRFASGIQVAAPVLVHDPVSAIAYQAGRPLELAYQVWAAGAAVLALAVVLSVAIYLDPVPTGRRRIDPVRLMGALLVVAAVVLTAATALLLSRGFPGVPVPVGVVFLYVLGIVLLLVERVDADDGVGTDEVGDEAVGDDESGDDEMRDDEGEGAGRSGGGTDDVDEAPGATADA